MKIDVRDNISDEVAIELVGIVIRQGRIYVVDTHGVCEDHSDVHYDILVESENCLYKHIHEKLVSQ
jgi:hypothetical protein